MIPIIIILIVILFFCLLKINKLNKEKTLKKYICFCCSKDDNKHRFALSLFAHIFNLQNNLNIDKKYCLVDSDRNNIEEILQEHNAILLQEYFDDNLNEKIVYKLTNEEFLVFHLWGFLRKENHFYRGKMYTYGKIPDGEYYRELHLTDFSLTYYKLFYITQLYCHNSANILKQFPDLCYENLEGTKEIIDSKIKKDYTR